jgi:3-phenylpropionate/cinnamic acid dioxygenase small subunit
MTDELKKSLLEDVVIFTGKQEVRTGAQALAPDHSPRQQYRPPLLPERGSLNTPMSAMVDFGALQRQVEQFLYYQSELLDTKNWQAYVELFSEDGVYWMPARAEQTEWLDSPSIFAEDRQLMDVRVGRITHPNAWSQAPVWGTSHVLGNVVVESARDTQVTVRSRFQVLELRRDVLRHFSGAYRHTLIRADEGFRIQLQRVDLLNAQAPFDYTIQAWI